MTILVALGNTKQHADDVLGNFRWKATPNLVNADDQRSLWSAIVADSPVVAWSWTLLLGPESPRRSSRRRESMRLDPPL